MEEVLKELKKARLLMQVASDNVKVLEKKLLEMSGIDPLKMGKSAFQGFVVEVPVNTKWDQEGLSALWDKKTTQGGTFGSLMKMELAFPAASLKLLSDKEKAEVIACRTDTPGSPKIRLED